ncbi:GAF domain-containing protein [bacterium]|nr:GAF domain-containing protein [candidate division CSSED10-310 bacterium]
MKTDQDYVELLARMSQTLNSSLDPSEVLSSAMDMVVEMMNAERGFITLLENGRLSFQVARNLERQDVEGGVEISRTLINKVVSEGIPVVTMDARMDDRFSSESSVIAYGLRSVLCVPLRIKDRIIGAIYIDNRAKTGVFTPKDKDMLQSLANQAAIAIENARLYDRLKHSIDEKLALQRQIHEEEKARAVIDETNKLREELVHYLVHDLRNPLTVIIGGLKILSSAIQRSLNEDNGLLLRTVTSNAAALLGMVNAILDVYKLEAGKMTTRSERVPIKGIIDNVVISHKNLTAPDVILHADFNPAIYINGDQEILYRILSNLVSNAIKFTHQGVVEIKAYQKDRDQVMIEVNDTGPGIPAEYHQKIFDKFQQVEAHKKTGSKFSTGLGLTFCRLAVELMGGRIWLDSTEGVGSSFYVLLPGGGPV